MNILPAPESSEVVVRAIHDSKPKSAMEILNEDLHQCAYGQAHVNVKATDNYQICMLDISFVSRSADATQSVICGWRLPHMEWRAQIERQAGGISSEPAIGRAVLLVCQAGVGDGGRWP